VLGIIQSINRCMWVSCSFPIRILLSTFIGRVTLQVDASFVYVSGGRAKMHSPLSLLYGTPTKG